MTPNADAGPLKGTDWPILISVAVTPGVAPLLDAAGAAGAAGACEPPVAGLSSGFLPHPDTDRRLANARIARLVVTAVVCFDMVAEATARLRSGATDCLSSGATRLVHTCSGDEC